jgi:ATP/ADP translocase
MTDGRERRFLRRFVDVRPDETRGAFYVILYFFLITLTFAMIKPAKDCLMVSLVTPGWWPYADFITAGLIGFAVALNARLLNWLPRRSYLTATLIFFLFSFIFFWYIFDTHLRSLAYSPTADSSGLWSIIPILIAIENSWPWPVIIFSFWSDVFIATTVTQFWISANDLFDPHQAKRTVSLFVTGGLFGGIAGSLLTVLVVRRYGQENALLFCSGILLLIVMVVNLVYAEQKKLRGGAEAGRAPAGARVGYLESLQAVRKNKYLRLLAGLLGSAMVVGSLLNYQFKLILKHAVPDRNNQASFIAMFYLAILVVATVFHLAATGRVLKKFGILLALLIAPLVLFVGSLSVFLIPAGGLMIWACFIRGSDKAFDTTISQSVRELLYIPIPADIKYKAKIFIDMFVSKFATGLGAGLYLLFFNVFAFIYRPDDPGFAVRRLGFLAIGFALVWIVLIVVIFAEYLNAIKKGLPKPAPPGHDVVNQNVDVDTTKLIFTAIQSRKMSSTLYAMNLFDLGQKQTLTPELIEILRFKEDELKARSLDAVFDVGSEVFYQEIEETITGADIEQMVREVMALDSYKTVINMWFGDIVGKKTSSEVERMVAAKLTGLMEPDPGVFRLVGTLLRDSSPDVLEYALASAAVHKRKEHVPLIIGLLGNPATCQAAQDALAAYGPDIVDMLRKTMHGAAVKPEVKSAVAEVLAKAGNQKAADILVEELGRGGESVEPAVIDALVRIRADSPDVHFGTSKVMASVYAQIGRGYKIFLGGEGGAAADAAQVSEQVRKASLDLTVKRIFDLLALIYPRKDIVTACQNILQGQKKLVDYSIELLDNILDRKLKTYLFPLIEDLPTDEKRASLKKLVNSLGSVSPRRRLK